MSEEQARSSQESSAISPKIEKSRNRRLSQVIRSAFVGGLWVASMGLGIPMNSGLRQVDHIVQGADNPSIQPDSANASPSQERNFSPETILSTGELSVYLDGNGFPMAYREGNGQLVEFSEEEKIQMLGERKRAMELQEDRIAFQRIRPNLTYIQDSTPEQPWVTETPEDVLSKEELDAKGITIINPIYPRAPQLHLRSSIFSGNNLLEPFDVLNANLPEEERMKITFVVVNSEILDATYALSPGYDSVRQYLDEFRFSYHEVIEEKASELQQNIDEYSEKLSLATDSAERSQWETAIIISRIKLFYYRNTMSPAELYAEVLSDHSSVVGRFIHTPDVDGDGELRKTRESIVFVALPDHKQTTLKTLTSLYFNKEGTAGLKELELYANGGAPSPDIDKSYPRPDFYRERGKGTFENEYYKYAASTPGFILRHELAHLLLMKVIPELSRQGLVEQSQLARTIAQHESVKKWIEKVGMQDRDIPLIASEYITDEIAMMTIESANSLRETGDTSEYPFAIEVFKTSVHPAGWHITEMIRDHLEQLRKQQEAI